MNSMKKSRRLRSLIPDEELYERRVAGESLRALAPDYGVVHTTLSDFFQRPEAVLKLREVRRRLRMEGKAREENERRLVQEVRTRARFDEKRDRWLQAWTPPKRLHLSEEILRLDANGAPRGSTSRERYSQNDDKAAMVVASGGGSEEVIEVTGLRTMENVLRNIDPQIIRAALETDADLARNLRPDDRGLRRLLPNAELIRRRAAGESLRSIAADYNVSHTTLSRYFNRPKVAKQLRSQRRRHSRQPAASRQPS
jgi:lambda repressor-like predicted transcriptional regulator